MQVLKTGEVLIASTTDYSSGKIGFFGGGVNDAYDLYFVKDVTGEYILVLFMKIQFFFKNNNAIKWTYLEKDKFIENWKNAIRNAWGNKRIIKYLKGGRKIFVDLRFETQIDGWMLDHWEITVIKIPKGAYRTSSVNPITGNVSMDSEDLSPISKRLGFMQRGALHEFGHMLGLDDEYEMSSKYNKDFSSIMNSGEVLFKRHNSVYMKWLDEILKKKNIN